MSKERYEVRWTETAAELLGDITDRRVRQLVFDTSKRLASEPSKQGAPLTRELAGFRDLRAVGQRYRLVYRVDEGHRLVHVVAVGLRRQDSRDDVYELAKRLLRVGLIESRVVEHKVGLKKAKKRPRK